MSNSEPRSALESLKQIYRWIKEPKHVEKASTWERRKRTWWMMGSTFLCLFAAALAVSTLSYAVYTATGYNLRGGLGIVVVTVAVFATALYVDLKYVFPWGMERFNLVVPWQFRDAEVEND